jgi:hypothetical protein
MPAHDIFDQNYRRQHVEAYRRLDLGIVHGREQALGADPCIVDEALDGAEFIAHAFDKARYGVDLAEIAGAEGKSAATSPTARNSSLPRHRDCPGSCRLEIPRGRR